MSLLWPLCVLLSFLGHLNFITFTGVFLQEKNVESLHLTSSLDFVLHYNVLSRSRAFFIKSLTFSQTGLEKIRGLVFQRNTKICTAGKEAGNFKTCRSKRSQGDAGFNEVTTGVSQRLQHVE